MGIDGCVIEKYTKNCVNEKQENDDAVEEEQQLITNFETNYKCEICSKNFKAIDTLNNHIKSHFEIYKCEQCGDKIIGDKLYNFHMKKLHPLKIQAQQESLRTQASAPARIRAPALAAPTSKLIQCKYCEVKFFAKLVNLNRHVRKIHKIITLKCKFCIRKFDSILKLNEHEEEIHPGFSKYPPYVCPTCKIDYNKAGFNKGSFRQHLITHYAIKPFICDVCGKDFAKKTNLVFHIRSHTGEKPFRCKICEKKFSLSHSVISHMKLHTNERPYKCKYCEKTYRHHTDLRRHKHRHENTEKKFKCPLCDYGCYELRFMKKHQQRHETV